MRILVLCDDKWHPGGTVRDGLAPLEDQGFTFDFIENAGEWSAERMGDYPVVVLSKSNNVSADDETVWMTESVEIAFRNYVAEGNGLLALHSGTAGYRDCAILRPLLGGVFLEHPKQCPVTVTPQLSHPLAHGSEVFTVVDEHYMMALDDANADVFVTTTSKHGTEPGGWRRHEGKGRVGVLTPGHNLEVWTHPAYQALIAHTLRWCGNRA